ncbi:MAG: transcription elongation factor GreA [Bacilli bacterium]
MPENQEAITRKGKVELEKRLDELVNVEKPKVLADLNLARSQGDLSENADYDAATEKAQQIESEISKIRYTLDHARIVDDEKGGDKFCRLGGDIITVKSLATNIEYKFLIVGEIEAKPSEGKISNTSPVAQAVIGHQAGDTVDVEVSKPYKLLIEKIGK